MHIGTATIAGRKAWELDNDALTLAMTVGGGHIARVALNTRPRINPMWIPTWKTIEPWAWRPASAKKYDIPLLASLCGHNLCLGFFGAPSPDEARCGVSAHGEAPVSRWKLEKKQVTGRRAALTTSCILPIAGMRFVRTISTRRGSHILRVREEIENLEGRDVPFTMCQHVTLGPPFLEKGVTVFDMSATKAHTFPGEFGKPQRLRPDTAFTWPEGPGARGEKVDMRLYDPRYRRSSDFTTQLMDPHREDAWFSAVNPRLGVMIAYSWRRADFPWTGNWEENYGRKAAPWLGRSLTRGMEFANAPFPESLRDAVNRGRFQGQPTFRWLPARGTIEMNYSILLLAVEPSVRGVADIRAAGEGYDVDLMY